MPIWRKFGMASENTASTMTRMIQTRLSRTNSTAASRRDVAAGPAPAVLAVCAVIEVVLRSGEAPSSGAEKVPKP